MAGLNAVEIIHSTGNSANRATSSPSRFSTALRDVRLNLRMPRPGRPDDGTTGYGDGRHANAPCLIAARTYPTVTMSRMIVRTNAAAEASP